MKVSKIILLLSILTINAHCQKQTIGLSGSVIHNLFKVDKALELDETISLPLNPILAIGVKYTHRIKDGPFHFYTSIQDVAHGYRVRRDIVRFFNGDDRMHFQKHATTENHPLLQLGAGYKFFAKNKRSLLVTIGPAIRYVREWGDGSFGVYVIDGVAFQGLSMREYVYKSKLHKNVFLRIDYDLLIAKNSKSKLSLNLICNLGLEPLTQSSSIINNFNTGVRREFVYHNRGTYFGVGLTYSRMTEDRNFWSLLKFRNIQK